VDKSAINLVYTRGDRRRNRSERSSRRP